MNFIPVDGNGPYERVNITEVLTDILNSPYDTVAMNESIVSRYFSPESCRSAFAMAIKERIYLT